MRHTSVLTPPGLRHVCDPRYDWVNKTLFSGTCARLARQVVIALFAVE